MNNVDEVAPGWGGTTPLIMSLYGCQETSTRQDVPPTALQLRLGVSRKCVFDGRGQAERHGTTEVTIEGGSSREEATSEAKTVLPESCPI